jgi:two-component system, response regulator FlrC
MKTPYMLWVSPKPPGREIVSSVESEGYCLEHTHDASSLIGFCHKYQPELAFVDSTVGNIGFVNLVGLIHRTNKDIQIISVINGNESRLASESLQHGAIDYLIKPFIDSQLRTSIRNAAAFSKGLKDLVAVSHASRKTLQLANRAAQTEATVLISGESGTGKEKLARFIHGASNRADKPFVAINCAAIPEQMLEAMLFGYNKGAFSGAVSQQIGKFEAANGGTLLLDEISELPMPLQAKLLRVLQEREVERLGSNHSIKLDIRVIAASNKNLRDLVARGIFREDLFYRLEVLPLSWPALRERRDDILPLAEFFISKHGADKYVLSAESKDLLVRYSWPGNVRELENVIQRAMIMACGMDLQPCDLSIQMSSADLHLVHSDGMKQTRMNAEFEYILELLSEFNGHRTRTAQALGVSTRALRYKLQAMREHGLKIDAIAS